MSGSGEIGTPLEPPVDGSVGPAWSNTNFQAYMAIAIAILGLIIILIFSPSGFFQKEIGAGRCHPGAFLVSAAISLFCVAYAAYAATLASPVGDYTVFEAAMVTFALFAIWTVKFFNIQGGRSLTGFILFFYIVSLLFFGYVVAWRAPEVALMLIYPLIFTAYLAWWMWASAQPSPETPI